VVVGGCIEVVSVRGQNASAARITTAKITIHGAQVRRGEAGRGSRVGLLKLSLMVSSTSFIESCRWRNIIHG
jgi:hypothetical protein